MSGRPLSERMWAGENLPTMFGIITRGRYSFLLAIVSALAVLLACSGVSKVNPNSGGSSGTGGGTGAGTGSNNLACNGMSNGATASLNGFVPFTGNNLWNTDISAAPVDPNSNAIITNWVGAVNLHPDWGNDPSYGIPYVVVDGKQPLVRRSLNAYGDESHQGPITGPAGAPVEGGSSSTADRHVLVLDNGNIFVLELEATPP